MNLYDTMFIPYAYQICVNSKVDLFANYLTNIYKNLSDKKKMERSDLMRMSHVSKRAEFDEAIETLKEAGAVIEYRFKGVTKPKTVYVYVPSPYAKLNFPQADNSKYAENGFFELTIKENVSPTPTEQSYLNNIVRDKIERKGKEYQEKKESSINSLNMDEFVFCFCDQFKDTDPAEIAILVKQIYGIPQVEQVIA